MRVLSQGDEDEELENGMRPEPISDLAGTLKRMLREGKKEFLERDGEGVETLNYRRQGSQRGRRAGTLVLSGGQVAWGEATEGRQTERGEQR